MQLPRYVDELTYRQQLGGIAHSTLHKLVKDGVIPPPVKLGRRNLWDSTTIGSVGAVAE
jgi:predicted DNA-binding transcriptional regulator AlpA